MDQWKPKEISIAYCFDCSCSSTGEAICRCEVKIKIPINIIETIEARSILKSNPPFAKGLVKKSPKVAQKGLVKMKAIQIMYDLVIFGW